MGGLLARSILFCDAPPFHVFLLLTLSPPCTPLPSFFHVSPKITECAKNPPSGPATVTVLIGTLKCVVMSFLTLGSPIVSSTPGGIERGVRPSLDGRVAVAEKVRLAPALCCWNAGTRKLGNIVEEEAEATDAARSRAALLGAASIFGRRRRRPRGGGNVVGCGRVVEFGGRTRLLRRPGFTINRSVGRSLSQLRGCDSTASSKKCSDPLL